MTRLTMARLRIAELEGQNRKLRVQRDNAEALADDRKSELLLVRRAARDLVQAVTALRSFKARGKHPADLVGMDDTDAAESAAREFAVDEVLGRVAPIIGGG